MRLMKKSLVMVLAVGVMASVTICAGQAFAQKKIKVGVSIHTLEAPYFVAEIEAIKKKAAESGIEVVSADGAGDMTKQISDIEELLAQKIDLLIIDPKDPKGLVPSTKLATDANVPVVIMDSSIDPSADFVTMVQSDNQANGKLVGAWLAAQMAGTPIKMGLISGVKGNWAGEERRQGVFRGLTEAQLSANSSAGFEVVAQGWGSWSHEGGLAAMENMIAQHPDMNVLLTENDSMALGALEVIKEAGKEKDILIVAAADAQKEALALIKSGQYGATGLNNPALIAETALEIGMKYLNGERNIPKMYYTPAVCITKDNIDQYYDPNAIF